MCHLDPALYLVNTTPSRAIEKAKFTKVEEVKLIKVNIMEMIGT